MILKEIALIIGVYVVTRMASFLTREGDREESGLVKACAVITIIVTAICLADIMIRG